MTCVYYLVKATIGSTSSVSTHGCSISLLAVQSVDKVRFILSSFRALASHDVIN